MFLLRDAPELLTYEFEVETEKKYHNFNVPSL